MLRLIAALAILLAISYSPAFACSLPTPVTLEDLTTGIVQEAPKPQRTPEQIADSLPEVVIEGVVIDRDPIAGEPGATDAYFKHARMRVDRVWKGEAAKIITLQFGEDTAMCQQVPPVGEHLRTSLEPISPNVFAYDVLSGARLGNPNEEAGLRLYRERTIAMQRKAQAGGAIEKRAFADYLRRNGETHRALWMYEAMVHKNPNDLDLSLALAVLQSESRDVDGARDTLARIRKVAPHTEEWRGKLARATFEATGYLDSDWKNWSNLANVETCYGDAPHYDDFNFANSRLNCRFLRTTLHGTDFRGADLTGVTFAEADLTGAKYDCATTLPNDFDPKAAGMINVQGNCTTKP